MLKPQKNGVPDLTDNDVAAIGGKVEYKASGRLDVTLSAAAVEALRKDGRVKYIQKAALGPPSPAAAASVLRLKPTAMSLHPKTEATPPTWLSGTYLYDTSGNIYAIGLAGDTGSPPQHHYAYDTLSRLTTANTTATLQPNETFVYDDYGNMTSHQVGSNTTTMSVVTATNRFTTGGTSPYQYDALGNLTADAEATYAYDPFSMLREKDYQAKLPEFYIYTASDERIGVKYDMYTTWSIRDFSGNVLRQYKGMDDQSNVAWLWVEDYIYRDGQLLGAERVPEEGGRRHFHLDHLGSPRLVTSTQTSSNEMSEHEFAPFGMEVNPLWQETTGGFDREDPKRFTAHERDYASDGQLQTTKYLDYMHARYYSPGVGRFLSVDPLIGNVTSPQTLNRFVYARNNPLKYRDPFGLAPCVPEGSHKKWYPGQCIEVVAKAPPAKKAPTGGTPSSSTWLGRISGAEEAQRDIAARGFFAHEWDELDHTITIGLLGVAVAETGDEAPAEALLSELGIDLEEVMEEPEHLVNMSQEELRQFVFRLRQDEWRLETLGRGSHEGEGLVLRETDSAGKLTGRMIQFHPGGGHHGFLPYWKVSSPSQGTIRAFYSVGGNW
ncbi:MAG TPA: RHS repeat-associated core domain-containing protein [Thermoanaerobaculia bacterium]|nr:RHS repeat-associated core domain-containing protein [Thermoanaerobaculia bacterium]